MVRNRHHNHSGTPSDGATGIVSGENHPIQKISQSKMTLINGVAFSANVVVVETMNRMSKSDSELCTQVTSDAKRSDSNLDVGSLTTSISSMGISNDTSTLKSVSNEELVNQRDLVNGYDTNEIIQQNAAPSVAQGDIKNEAESNDEATNKVNRTPALTNDATVLPKQRKSRSERSFETKVKATNTLVPRYHAVGHECSVLSCINQFTAMELLTGNNKFGCEKCTLHKYGKQNKEGKCLYGSSF